MAQPSADPTHSTCWLPCLKKVFPTIAQKKCFQQSHTPTHVAEKLFSSSTCNPNHVLHRLLPQPKNTGHNRRQRTHSLMLSTDVNAVVKQNSCT